MKKPAQFLIIIFIGILLNFFFSKNSFAAELNLIQNPSVESALNSNPLYWNKSKSGTNSTSFTYQKGGYSGNRSLKVNVSSYKSGELKWSFNPISINSSSTYKYSEYYISNTTSYIYASATDSKGNQTTLLLSTAPKSSNWKQINLTYSPPADSKTLSIYHALKSTGTLQTDTFSLTEVIPPYTAPLPPDTAPLPPGTAPLPPTTSPIIEPPSAPLPISGNLMINNSLEEISSSNQNLPSGWVGGKYGTNSVTFLYLNTGHTGSKSLKIDVTSLSSGDAKWLHSPIEISSGGTYKFEDYYQSDVDTEIDAEFHMQDGSIQYKYLGTVPPSSSWSKASVQFTPPSNVKSVVLFHLIDAVGYLITDDYYLSQYTPNVAFNRPIVSLTFDDGFLDHYSTAFPLLKKYGYTGTFYVVSGYLGFSGYMNNQNVIDLYNAGNEIGSHTVSHAHLTTLSSPNLAIELSSSQSSLQTLLNTNVPNFCSPFGEYNSTTVSAIKRFYKSHRTVDSGYNTKENFDPYKIVVQNVHSDVSVDMVKSWIDKATADKSWLVLVYHKVRTDVSDLYTTTPSDFDAQLDYLKQKGVSVQTVDKALEELSAQIN